MPALVEVIGLDGLRELEELVSKKVHDTGVTKEEWRQVLTRLDILEHDMAEVKLELRELRKEMDAKIDGIRGDLNTKFYWLIGLLFASGITIILTILFKA